MRRFICLLLAVVMATMLTFNIQAAEKDTQEDNVIYLENGDYIVVKVIEQSIIYITETMELQNGRQS